VQAAVDRNPALIQNDLHPHAALMHLGREDILYTLKTGSDAVGLRGARITGMETDVTDSLITVRFRVMSDHDPAVGVGYGTYLSTWEVNWLETDQGWLLKDIVPIELGGQQVGHITRYLHRRGE